MSDLEVARETKFKFDIYFFTNFIIFAIPKGGLAQLARAFAWHARGHRFDSDILHSDQIAQKAIFFMRDVLLLHFILAKVRPVLCGPYPGCRFTARSTQFWNLAFTAKADD